VPSPTTTASLPSPTTTASLPSPTTTEVSTPCQDESIMTDSSRVSPGSITTSPEISSENLQAILSPNNQSPITIEGSEITITVNVEAEYTAIEVNGENYNSLVIIQIVQLTKRISVNGANLLLHYKSIHFSRIKTKI
jgi:hypothetical protein